MHGQTGWVDTVSGQTGFYLGLGTAKTKKNKKICVSISGSVSVSVSILVDCCVFVGLYIFRGMVRYMLHLACCMLNCVGE
jgi:hypothetical protein